MPTNPMIQQQQHPNMTQQQLQQQQQYRMNQQQQQQQPSPNQMGIANQQQVNPAAMLTNQQTGLPKNANPNLNQINMQQPQSQLKQQQH